MFRFFSLSLFLTSWLVRLSWCLSSPLVILFGYGHCLLLSFFLSFFAQSGYLIRQRLVLELQSHVVRDHFVYTSLIGYLFIYTPLSVNCYGGNTKSPMFMFARSHLFNMRPNRARRECLLGCSCILDAEKPCPEGENMNVKLQECMCSRLGLPGPTIGPAWPG